MTEEGIEKTLFLKAPVPQSVILYSIASASTIVDVMIQKYVNGTPLYRQAESWNRQGVDLHRNTLSNWIILATRDWLTPVYSACKKSLMKGKVIHADETTVQMLKGQTKTRHQNPECRYMHLQQEGGTNSNL